MRNLARSLKEVVSELGALGAIVFSASGHEIVRVGDIESAKGEGLFAALFGGPNQVRRLQGSLEGQLLPQIWSQGGMHCFVSRITNGTVYGVFSRRALDPVGLYLHSQEAARALEEVLERPGEIGGD